MAYQNQIAASTSVGTNTLKPPQNAFMQGLGNVWGGIKNATGTGLNFLFGIPGQTPTANSWAGQLNPSLVKPQVATTQGNPSIDVAASKGQIPLTSTQMNQALAANPLNAKTLGDVTSSSNNIDPNAVAKAALQAQISALQGQVNIDKLNGYTGNQVPQYDLNGNLIPESQSTQITANTPISGSTTGATVGNPTGGANAQNSVISNMANGGTLYNQVAQNLANLYSQPSTQVTAANQNLQKIQNQAATAQAGTENVAGGAPITASDQAGQAGILNRLYAAKIANAQQAVQNALTSQGQGIQGQQAALGALQPQLGQYGQTYYTPYSAFTGQTGTQGANQANNQGGTLNPLNNLQSIATQVINGQMSLTDALSMGGNISNWSGALNQAILAQNPNFNSQQANVNAQAQGALAPQSSLASQELANLQNTLSNVPGWQKTSIPAINALGSLVDNALGMGSSQALTSAVSAARSSITTALGTAYNTTPTAFTGMVNSWIPDNPTPSQVQAAIGQFNTLMKARASSYASPGTTTNPLTNTGGFNQGQTAAGGSLIWNGTQWVVNK